MTDLQKVAKWMIERSYATGHGDTIEDLLEELEWQIAENWTNALVKGVQTEREACAKLCEEQQFTEMEDETCEPYNMGCRHSANAIRARGEK